jgi:hypothetical protein
MNNFVAPLLHPKPRSARGILGYAVGMMGIPETGLRPFGESFGTAQDRRDYLSA